MRRYIGAKPSALVRIEMVEHAEQFIVGSFATPRAECVLVGVIDVDVGNQETKDGRDEYPARTT
jgi:hypothetical protein